MTTRASEEGSESVVSPWVAAGRRGPGMLRVGQQP